MTGFAAKSPGVYLQNVDESASPGLVTGVPVFLGPVNPPLGSGAFQLDGRSFAELDAKSPAWSSGKLRMAVRGFFENGGQTCHVLPLADGAALPAALAKLAAMEGFDLVAAPDLSVSKAAGFADWQLLLLKACAMRGDCFALLDSPYHGGPASDWLQATAGHRAVLDGKIQDAAKALKVTEDHFRIHGAIYAPWCHVRNADGAEELAPPSGHVAGVLARVDGARGAHKAPANEVVEGLLDVQVRLDAAAQEALNPTGKTRFNCLRAFPGRGIRVHGARTLSDDPVWAHVGARRTVVSLRRFVDFTMPSMAFEPNDLRLWIRIQRELSGFLNGLYSRGALRGASPEEAYYVKCDAETNPPAVRDAGQVVTEVGLALATPKEHIVVRLTHDAAGAAAAATPA